MSVVIERASVDSEESRQLIVELWREVDELYGNAAPSKSALCGMDAPGAAFVLARRDEVTVGCGAVRPLTRETAEIKRMYVRPAARRTGVARQIMEALEKIARAAGFSAIWLETGLRQPAAVRLYESLGYTRIAAFGDYKDDPQSICFGKSLT